MPSVKTVDVDIELDTATLEYFKATWPDDFADRMAEVLNTHARTKQPKQW